MALALFWIVIGANIGALMARLGLLDELFDELGPLPWEEK